MSIRINRQRIAAFVQGFTQRSEDATYSGPRRISDKDVAVTLPVTAEQFEQQRFFQEDADATGTKNLTLSILGDGPNDTLRGEVARITSITAAMTTIAASSIGARRIGIDANVIDEANTVTDVLTAYWNFDGEPGETLILNDQLQAIRGLLIPPGQKFFVIMRILTATGFVNSDFYGSQEAEQRLSIGYTTQELPFLPIQ